MDFTTFATMGKVLASNEGTEVHLVGPDGFTPLFAVEDAQRGWIVTVDAEAKGAVPCIMTVVGQDSRTYRRRRHEMVDAMRNRQRSIKSAQAEQEAMKMVAAGVVGWKNIPWSDADKGYLLSFTDDNLLMFLEAYRPAFDQLNEFIADRTRFLRIDATA
ncbi:MULTISPECIES: hypothetical protein [Gemmobacter]|uniref:Uncharacterized protein n=1 Tax=Gemmobacter caeni TaxID=589035 RepID=A0A2T6APC7_9RHOB|nr:MULTISPECIES: hypothetical protein [Gemmobacter]PTX45640.1 hypothetical protein C8N34_12170 [Gemmobacter caeni]TWI93787.1 hypothetical protein IQ03_04548 [Gemmobacter caeni]